MRIKTLLALGAVTPFLLSAQIAETMDFGADTSVRKLSEEEILTGWGWLLSERFNLDSMEFSAAELELMFKGMRSQAKGEAAPQNLSRNVQQMQLYFAQREERVRKQRYESFTAMELEFFDKLFGTPGVGQLATGLHYEILEKGSKTRPGSSDWVEVHYRGELLTGKVFDSTFESGQTVPLKLDQVIEGWSQGIPLIGEGGRIKLYVPARLGYGAEGRSGIPPGATLVFEVELVKVLDGPPEGVQGEVAP